MNEQIRELFKRAGGKTTTHNLASNPVQYREINELWDDRIEKFAELIVRECQSRVEQYINDCSEIGSLPDTVIKKHFGVEE